MRIVEYLSKPDERVAVLPDLLGLMDVVDLLYSVFLLYLLIVEFYKPCQ